MRMPNLPAVIFTTMLITQAINIMPTDFPIYKKKLPQIWIEDDRIIEDVLYNVEDTDWIYTQIQDSIDDELKEVVS